MRKLKKYFTLAIILLTALVLIAISPIWLTMAALSFMAFDQGISIQGVLFVLSICLLPFAELCLIYYSFRYYFRQAYGNAVVFLLPIWLVLMGILWLTGFDSGIFNIFNISTAP